MKQNHGKFIHLFIYCSYLKAPIKTTGSQALKGYPPEVPITQTYELIWAFIYLCINYIKKIWENVLWEEPNEHVNSL